MFTRVTKLAVIVGGILLAGLGTASGQACGEWMWTNPAPQGNLLAAVAHGVSFEWIGRLLAHRFTAEAKIIARPLE